MFKHFLSALTRLSSPLNARQTGFLIALTGACLFASKGIVAKLLYREGVDATTLMALRMLMSAPVFALIALFNWRSLPALSGLDLLKIAGLGFIGYYLSSFLSFLGLQYVSAGLERLILFLNPTLILLLNWLWFGRRVSKSQWASMGVCYLGIVAVFWNDVHVSGDHTAVLLGSALVLASAVSYALYLLLSGEMVARYGSLRLVSLAMLTSTAYKLGHCAVMHPDGALFTQTAAVWKLASFNAIFCTVIPVTLLMIAVKRLGAGTTAQLGMVSPVATIGFSAVLLNEPITGLQILGTLLAIGGIVILARAKTPEKPTQ